MPGTVSPPPRSSDLDMLHGTCVTHVPWCMPGSLTSGFLWSRWRGKRSRYSRRMRNLQFCVSGKRPIGPMLIKLGSLGQIGPVTAIRWNTNEDIQYKTMNNNILPDTRATCGLTWLWYSNPRTRHLASSTHHSPGPLHCKYALPATVVCPCIGHSNDIWYTYSG